MPEDLQRTPSLLTTRAYGRSLEVLAETGSTNDDARAAAEHAAPRGHVIVADAQRAGRGARGAAWSSPAGTDLYLSIVERAELAPSALATLTLAVGLGVRDACAALLEARGCDAVARVKWPNDVRLRQTVDGGVVERKCAGILVESSSIGERIGPIIIGIGLDVNRTEWPPELADIATSLRDASGAPLDRAEALATLFLHVEARVDAHLRDGAARTVAALRPHLSMLGEAVELDGQPGVLEGLDDEGWLLLRTPAGPRRFASGSLLPSQLP